MANAHERFMQVAMEAARTGAAEGNAAVGSVGRRRAPHMRPGQMTVRDPKRSRAQRTAREFGPSTGRTAR